MYINASINIFDRYSMTGRTVSDIQAEWQIPGSSDENIFNNA